MTVQEKRLLDHLVQELEGTHLDYLNKLKRSNPRMTPYELRLCAYIKSNLTTKEIATILNIQPDSVKKAKQRLRRKMGIKSMIAWNEAMME